MRKINDMKPRNHSLEFLISVPSWVWGEYDKAHAEEAFNGSFSEWINSLIIPLLKEKSK